MSQERLETSVGIDRASALEIVGIIRDHRPADFFLRNKNASGNTGVTATFGNPSFSPLSGNWAR